MGVLATVLDDARDRLVPRRSLDRGKAPTRLRAGRRVANRLTFAICCVCIWAAPISADTIRLALWHEALSRDGPGALLRDILRKEDDIVRLAIALETARPDILVLTKFDYDASGLAATAFGNLISEDRYPFVAALRANEGVPTGVDLDGDGRIGEPEDAQGYGRFPGQGGLAILSRFPIKMEDAQSFNEVLWKEVPGTHMLPSDAGLEVQALSSGGHWIVPVEVPLNEETVELQLLVGHAGPPVFDGPEDRNGRRNLDELRMWSQILAGERGGVPGPNTVFMATTNLDPERGEGYRLAMRDFLADGPFQDPLPSTPTADWDNPGSMRVSYLLPSQSLRIVDAMLWPRLPESTHRLIIVDIALPESSTP